MARNRVKRISSYMEEMLAENYKDTTTPKNKVLSQMIFDIAMDEKQNAKTRIEAMNMILDRTEGKAVQTNINAEVEINPFEGIPTEQIEALKKQFELLKQ